MRYLGIDYGTKRIGLAISDPDGRMAFPYGRVKNIEGVVGAARKENVDKIIIGVPVLWRGGQAPQMKVVERFAARLQKTLQLPVEFENEMFTSKIAEQTSRRDKADASAAALILQSYLDKPTT